MTPVIVSAVKIYPWNLVVIPADTLLNPREEAEDTKVNATWYQMIFFVPEHHLEKHAHHRDLYKACVIREATGELLDDPKADENLFHEPKNEKLNFTGRAMVGLTVNEVEWLQLTSEEEKIPETELEEMYYKMKIYACDDLDAEYVAGE